MNMWKCSQNIGLRSTLHIHITTREREWARHIKSKKPVDFKSSNMSFDRTLLSLFSSSYPASTQSELCSLQERSWALSGGNPLHNRVSLHKPAIEALARNKAAIVALCRTLITDAGSDLQCVRVLWIKVILNNTQSAYASIWVFYKINSNSSGMEGFGNVFERRETG